LTAGGCLGLSYDFGFARCVFSFFLGTLAWHVSRRLPASSLPAMQWISLALLAAGFMLLDSTPWLAFLFPFAFTLLVLSICHDKGVLARLLQRKPLQLLGRYSYSIYMLHLPLLLFFENVSKRVDGFWLNAAVLIAYVAALLLASAWTYRNIEDPFRKMFNRIADNLRFGEARQDFPAKAGVK
jgi:peptidoglycan/LPS O-acetylase OafA/YrhL